MVQSVEFGQFLRSRRDRLCPEEVGLPPDPRPRRVRGLRRQEVAQLAGVSTEYYTRLEQGRGGNVSESVLTAIATALRLDAIERGHLFDLGGMNNGVRRPPLPQRVHPGWHRLLDSLALPAFVLGRRMDVLASNPIARLLLTDFDALPPRERNFARFMFLDPAARSLCRDWAEVAAETVAILRLDAGRHPGDRQLEELVTELAAGSPEFARWWADQRVSERTRGTKRYRHPVVGDLTVDYEAMQSPGDPDMSLFVYSAEPGSTSERALRELARRALAAEPIECAPGQVTTGPHAQSAPPHGLP
ncbi:MAG: helix-turn-helix transcriptional regulator [Pseudonocardia sp.]